MGWTFGRVASRVAVGCVLVLGGAAAGFGQIVITEVMPNPASVDDTPNGEWFELYNAGDSRVNLKDWKLKDDVDTLTTTEQFTISGDLFIASGTYLLFALSATAVDNGGLPAVDYVYPSSGSMRISLGNSTDGLVLTNATDVEQDRLVWTRSWPFGAGESMAFKDVTVTDPEDANDAVANWCESPNAWAGSAGDKGTPGAANDCPLPPTPPDDFTGEIFEIQSSDRDSPYEFGKVTTTDNIVTALVGTDGFIMQTPTSRSDNNVNTSDGIYVMYSGAPTVMVGDQVDVVGKVREEFGTDDLTRDFQRAFFTRIDATVTGGSVTLDASPLPVPAPVEFDASRPSPNPRARSCAWEYECYEGMRIRIASGTVATGSQKFSGDDLAEMYITATSSRPFREPGIHYSDRLPGLPVWDGNPEVFELDPNRLGLTNVSWVPGTTFTATGVLAFEHFGFEIWPTELVLSTAGPALPRPVRAKLTGEVTVASQNLLDLRSTANATKLGKLSKLVREVLGSPDVVAVQEVYGQTALENLATQISTDDSNVTYTAHVAASGSSLSVGFLVRSGVTANSVTEHGKSETYIDPRDGSVDTLNDRPPTVLDATVGAFDFSVVVIHNRSLIRADDAVDGENIRTKRLGQAQSVARLVQSLQDSKVIVVGDYNAYEFTDGYVDVVGQISGKVTPSRNLMSGPDLVTKDLCVLTDRVPAADRYSLLFRGSAQMLDHALVNQNLERHVVGIQYARGNADAAGNSEDDATNALYATDHDGFVVYLSPDAKPPVNPSPCQGPAPPPSGGGAAAQADLNLNAESQMLSDRLVRYSVSVENEGPGVATNVVVTSSLSAGGVSLETSTSGCGEDPGGVPDCSLGDIAAGDSAAFTIRVETSGASENSLRYSGSTGSDVPDPTPEGGDVTVTQPLGPPNAPSDFSATAISSTEIELRWRDNSNVETGFAVYQQGPGDSKLRPIGMVPANTTSAIVEELVPDITYRFAVEARNGPLNSERTPKSTATTWFSDAARCGEDDVLCLGSFQVEIEWDAGEGNTGRGMAERLTPESGDFWFFDAANIEMVVKVLDGCALNGHYWVYAAGLTDVGVTTTVQDLRTGAEKSWMNPRGTLFEPIADTSAFATCDSAASARRGSGAVLSGAPPGRVADLYQASLTATGEAVGADGACVGGDTALCLQASRFEVRANWHVGDQSGAGMTIPRTADTGMFWFFSEDNVELIVKVLDGCALNGHRWVLMGGLTDVVVDVSVTDSETGEARMYRSPGGSPFQTMFDVTAFSCSAGQ